MHIDAGCAAFSMMVSARMPRPLATTRGRTIAVTVGDRGGSAFGSASPSFCTVTLCRVQPAVVNRFDQAALVLLQQRAGVCLLGHQPDAECLLRIKLDVYVHCAEIGQSELEPGFPGHFRIAGGWCGCSWGVSVSWFTCPFQLLPRPQFAAPDELGGFQHLQLLRQQGVHRVGRFCVGEFSRAERIGQGGCRGQQVRQH